MPKTHKDKETMLRDFDKLFEDKNRKKKSREKSISSRACEVNLRAPQRPTETNRASQQGPSDPQKNPTEPHRGPQSLSETHRDQPSPPQIPKEAPRAPQRLPGPLRD